MTDFGLAIASKVRAGDVVALEGDLGAGKTTLARAIISGLGHKGEVPSPTFTIIELYEALSPPIVHADFYRLKDPSEIFELGLDDYREGAALIAEWPEKAGGFSQDPACLSIELEIVGQARRANVQFGKEWLDRLP